ncbi:prepilin-type N-terminal cleavage/methylation domain-containing protein [Aromatoleum toluvorans]|uniref:Prepilin-type N-terminal cleavage/methylation domain-containing protein n=1 Tax=Aromatoleum toluvorans TaxID=92002 RepID=A0ABX1Q403_9RHOO|nr:prepilin-type N-terminal cleavage/methylation domain-containing protein [Aromatoleum toluvorans]NMG45249.1 prepilin-type N-terminal cleavage/methylation domain-containing protein [Aromatoleum toluvorans]
MSAGRSAATRGFTLVELLVVLAIIATLMSIAAPRYFEHLDRSREASLRQTLVVVRDAIDKYHADIGAWPPDLDALVTKRYLRKLPFDPITERSDSWQYVAPPGGDGTGVWDLHSGAEGTAKDGTRYADW